MYNTIKKYFPIGIKKNRHLDIYRQYPGIRELEKMTAELFTSWRPCENLHCLNMQYGRKPIPYLQFLQFYNNSSKKYFEAGNFSLTIKL